jgi:hypothetical protein
VFSPVLAIKHLLHTVALYRLCTWQELHSHKSSDALTGVLGHSGIKAVVEIADPVDIREALHAAHLTASLLLRIKQVEHSHSPGAGLNLSRGMMPLELTSLNSVLPVEQGFFPRMSITLPDFTSVTGSVPEQIS